MANIKFVTAGIQNPQGKPRVYFSCHPMDFNKVFQDDLQPYYDFCPADEEILVEIIERYGNTV